MKNYFKIKRLYSFLVFGLVIITPKLLVAQGSPVKIFYGLNESHSDNWANYAPNGEVGIVYFKPFHAINSRDGELIYKTILPHKSEHDEVVLTGEGMEISILLFDSDSKPHIFLAISNDSSQKIEHIYKTNSNWMTETIVEFSGNSGKHIFELSGKSGSNNTYHLCVLKTRSNPDSDDYLFAFQNSVLYYVTNKSGAWKKERVHTYDTVCTMEEHIKSINRQDIEIDKSGNAHIIFGEQINGLTAISPSQLNYATNVSGDWEIEVAVSYQNGTRDDAGLAPSLSLDNNGIPYITCCYIVRVPTGSAMSANLLFVERESPNNWRSEIVATTDDGYYGSDGNDYTGALSDLVFDSENNPHIIFSDIASSHGPMNYLNVGNIRYAKKIRNNWDIETVYRQPLRSGFYSATEMYSMCLLYTALSKKFIIVGQELVVESVNKNNFNLIELNLGETVGLEEETPIETGFDLLQNFPNPFNPESKIRYRIDTSAPVILDVYSLTGEKIIRLVEDYKTAGNYEVTFDGTNLPSGVYFYTLIVNDLVKIKKMLLLK